VFNKLLQYAPVQILSALSVFLLIALQAKFLTLEKYGVLAVFMLITEVSRSFSVQWVNSSMLRLYPSQSPEYKLEYLTAGIVMSASLFIPAMVLIALGIFYYELLSLSTLLILSLFLLSKSVYLFFLDVARLNNQVTLYRVSSAVQSVSAVTATFFLLKFDASLVNAFFGLIVSYFLVVPLLLKDIKVKWPINKTAVNAIVKYGLPLMMSGVLANLASRVDRLFVADNAGLAGAGVYAGISNILMGVMALVFMVVAMPLYPELTKAIGEKGKLAELHKKYFNMLLLISAPALLGMCVLAEPLIMLFLTPSYLDYGVEVFYILAASVFLLNLRGHYIDHGLQFTLSTKFMPIIVGASLLVNLAVLIFLIDPYGLYGAAWASLVTSVFSLVLSFLIATKKGYKYSVDKNMFKTLGACCVMFSGLLVVKQQLVSADVTVQLAVLVLFGVFSYTLSHWCLNTMNVRSLLVRNVGL